MGIAGLVLGIVGMGTLGFVLIVAVWASNASDAQEDASSVSTTMSPAQQALDETEDFVAFERSRFSDAEWEQRFCDVYHSQGVRATEDAWRSAGNFDNNDIRILVQMTAKECGGDSGPDQPVAANNDASQASPADTPMAFAYGTGECPPTEGVTAPVKTFTAAPQQCIDPTKTYTATVKTDHGDIVITLDPAQAPGTVNNFVTLARYGYYDDTTIFRSAQSIDIIQGGGNSSSDEFGYTIPDEGSNWTYPPGEIAMANTGAPDSGGAQWFITTGPNAAKLDAQGTYTLFGDVTSGLDVAQKIAALATSATDDSMKEKVVVERITIAER
jgi:cyclophilin family peptidyl-prolyl cis-trans isomerase